jgi:hypothetical protein
MSFIQDSRHFTFSSSRAILHDVTTSTFVWDAASLFNVSAPSSAVYATVACESFSCINGFYSVTTRNNCIAVDSFTQLFLPEGFYTGISLASAVQTLLRPVLGSSFTCTYSACTGRITMSNTGNFTVFGGITTASKLLGMAEGVTYSGFNSYTFPNLADLQTVSRVILASNIPTKNRDGSTGVAFLGSFAVSAGPFQFFAVEQNQFESITDLQLSISNLQVQLLDQDGLPAINRAEFSICLEITTYHNPTSFAVPTPLHSFIAQQQQNELMDDETELNIP